MRTRLHNFSKQRMAGFALIAAGAILLTASGAYYAYGEVAKSRLGELSYSADRPSPAGLGLSLPPVASARYALDSFGAAGVVSSRSQSQSDQQQGRSATQTVVQSNTPTQQASSAPAGSDTVVEAVGNPGAAPAADTAVRPAGQAVQPAPRDRSQPASPKASVATLNRGGVSTSPSASAETSRATEASQTETALVVTTDNGSTAPDERSAQPGSVSDGPAPSLSLARPAAAPGATTDENDGGSAPALSIPKAPPTAFEAELAKYVPPDSINLGDGPLPAMRIRIPTIAVDSGIKDLELVSVNDSLAWETPKNTVGHIPTTARPAGQGEGWYFGHLESPIRGEGNVFLRLPEIPRLAEAGPVYVVLEDGARSYLYQVYKTEVMHRDQLKISDSGTQDITLVTCVPRFVYDHRLVVTAALVGVKES